jgi:AraC-like DNA-binding protein
MYVSIMKRRLPERSYRETRFRLPSEPEREMGLWVDRIGSDSRTGDRVKRLRILGQYAAVSVEAGCGVFVSPAAGRLRLNAGDVVLLFPEEPNGYYGTPAWTTRWIVWNGAEAGLVARISGLTPSQPVIRHAAACVARTFAALQALMQAEDFPAVLDRKRLLLGLLAELVRQADPGRDRQRDSLAALVRRLGEGAGERVTVPAMAAACHLSVSQFRRSFRASTGRSPLAFLTALRMADAKALLSQGAPMKEVAGQTGYRDVFHFMRVFRKATGQTAGAFIAAGR